MTLFLFVPILFWSCLDQDSDIGESFCIHDPPLSYANFGKSFIDLHCVGCHSADVPESHRVGAPLGVDFNTYDHVMDWSERIEARATRAFSDIITMPPGGGPTSSELDLFEEWLYCAVMPQKEVRDSQ
jgi:uncharacterized membrane protein